MSSVQWSHPWENDLTLVDHADLSLLLQLAFPWTSDYFTGSRSWACNRPERRVIARAAGQAVGHAGILRRFLRIDGVDQLVGEVGLLAVHPDWEPSDLSYRLATQVGAALAELRVPFGFFNSNSDVATFYTGVGWKALPPETMTRTPTVHSPFEASLIGSLAVVLPVTATIDRWPAGDVIDRHGFET